MDELRRAAAPLLSDSPVAATPLEELERRSRARTNRRRVAVVVCVGVLAVVVAGGAARARSNSSSVEIDTASAAAIADRADCATSIAMQTSADGATVTVRSGAPQADVDAVSVAIATETVFASSKQKPRAAVFATYKAFFADDPTLARNATEADMPTVFEMTLAENASDAAVGAALERLHALSNVSEAFSVRKLEPCRLSEDAARALADRIRASRQADVVVYMNAKAIPAQVDAVRDGLLADESVVGVVFSSQTENYENFKCLFSESPAMIETVTPEILPSSFMVNTNGDQEVAERLSAELASKSEVQSVAVVPTPEELISGADHGDAEALFALGAVERRIDCPKTGTKLK